MLILTRRSGQSIMIGDSIKLTVMDAGKSKVRIGIEAPNEVSVHREEIYQRITDQNADQHAGQIAARKAGAEAEAEAVKTAAPAQRIANCSAG